MSINAIVNGYLYDFYYQIDNKKKQESPLAKELKEYGLTPTGNDALDIAALNMAKSNENVQQEDEQEEYSDKSSRPWADIMYQLNLEFNEDPKDDIEDIKDELEKLMLGIHDTQLEREIKELKNYVEQLYLNYMNNSLGTFSTDLIEKELEQMSNIGKMSFNFS